VSSRRTLLADLGLLYCAAVWGATFFLVKGLVAELHPLTVISYRFLFAALPLAAYLLYKRRPLWRDLKAGLVLSAILWLIYAPQTLGLRFTTASNSGFITGTFIAFVPPLNYLLNRVRPAPLKLFAVLLSLGGLWLLTGGPSGANPGDLLTVFSAAAYAAHILFADRYIKAGRDILAMTFQQFAFVGAFSLLLAAVFGFPLSIASPDALGLLVFLALFPNLSAFLVQFFAQKIASPLKVSLFLTLEPVFAALFAWTLGREPFLPTRALGGALIVAAMLLSELPVRRGRMGGGKKHRS